MGRNSCCVKQKLRKGLWSPEEDEKLYNYITRFGVGCWSSVPKLAGLQRCGKSCRLRWINYLRPDLKRGMFSQEEEDLIIRLHQALGNRWAQIASQLPGRTDNEIKNFWNSSLKKKLIKHGIDPNTHKLINDARTQSKHSTDSTSLQNLQPQSLTNSTPSSHMEQQSYNLSSSIICTNVGAKLQPSTDHFSIKEVYDPLFLSEFQPNIYPHYFQSNFLSHRHQNHLRPYETDGDLISPITRFNSIPSSTNFDHHIYTHYSSSRMSKIQNQMINNNEIENGGSFSWDDERKLDSVFQFELGGIQIEERKPNNLIPGDFSNYPLTSLCQELTGQNMDVFLGSI